MYLQTGAPFQGRMLEKLRQFLAQCGLDYDESIFFSAALMEEEQIIACGSLDGATVKCVAVSPAHQGEDLTARIMTALAERAAQDGNTHLMLYTKPQNRYLFQGLGFHPVIHTADCLLMENRRGGIDRFLASLSRPADDRKPVGCIVANCNPFTKGHRYLIETAATECAWVHVFVLSEDKSLFSAEMRMRMVKEGWADLANVLVHPSGPSMVSSATFPDYFLKDKLRADDIRCEMDVRLFGEKIAPALGITRRYAGTEPACAVTAAYNARMQQLLPSYGVDFCQIPRREADGAPISAAQVRSLLAQGQTQTLHTLLPESSIRILSSL